MERPFPRFFTYSLWREPLKSKKWIVTAKRADFNKIARACGISPVLARLIRNRDVIGEEATEKFLRGTLEDLHDPALLPDAERAVDILAKKREEGKRIRIIGDYDVDGICASFILWHTLNSLGIEADAKLPERIRDGYGINERLVKEAAEDGVDTILTCDNGIAAVQALQTAKDLGMTVIVTDHHEVPFKLQEDGSREYTLPPADAVVDPKIPESAAEGSSYPFPDICGAVVAFKICLLLAQKLMGGKDSGKFRELRRCLIPFAGIATVCDVMPLRDENRIIVREGLGEASFSDNLGLVSALQNAQQLKDLNDSRKSMTAEGTDAAEALIETENMQDRRVLVILLRGCHESLAGIIAGRIKERMHRPAFVLTDSGEGVLKGSGRSIESYDMYAEMNACEDLFIKYGGHKMAGGLSMKEENFAEFSRRIEENCTLTKEQLQEVIRVDMELPPRFLGVEMTRELALLEPCGTDNPRPLFVTRNIRLLSARVLGRNRNVVRLGAQDDTGARIDLIRFGDAADFEQDIIETAGRGALEGLFRGAGNVTIDMVYYPDINVWNGRESMQYIVKDYRIHS